MLRTYIYKIWKHDYAISQGSLDDCFRRLDVINYQERVKSLKYKRHVFGSSATRIQSAQLPA